MAEGGGEHDNGRVARGTWVELHRVVLALGERPLHLPNETQRTPLELRVKGFLTRDATPGAEAEVRTMAGRVLRGTLDRVLPAYEHGFGPPVPELMAVGPELRAILRGEEPER